MTGGWTRAAGGARFTSRIQSACADATAPRSPTASDMWYNFNGCIVFTVSKRLSGIGVPRKAVTGDASYGLPSTGQPSGKGPLGWDDVRGLTKRMLTRRVIDDTPLPTAW